LFVHQENFWGHDIFSSIADQNKMAPVRSTSYRRKLKEEDPEKYKKYLEEARIRAKERRDGLKEALKKRRPSQEVKERKRKIQEQTKLRVREYRRRKFGTPSAEKCVVQLPMPQTGVKDYGR
jgi:Fe-S cluster assembly scaffold protein SufB